MPLRERTLPESYPSLDGRFRGVLRLTLAAVALVPCGLTWAIPLTGQAPLGAGPRAVCLACGALTLALVLGLGLPALRQAARDRAEALRLRAAGHPATWLEVYWDPDQSGDRRRLIWPYPLLLLALLGTSFLLPLQWEPSFQEGPHPWFDAAFLLYLPLLALWALALWGQTRLRAPGPRGRVRWEAPLERGVPAELRVELPGSLRGATHLAWELRVVRRVSEPGPDDTTRVRHRAAPQAAGQATPHAGQLTLHLEPPAGAPPTDLPHQNSWPATVGTFWELALWDPSDPEREALFALPIY